MNNTLTVKRILLSILKSLLMFFLIYVLTMGAVSVIEKGDTDMEFMSFHDDVEELDPKFVLLLLVIAIIPVHRLFIQRDKYKRQYVRNCGVRYDKAKDIARVTLKDPYFYIDSLTLLLPISLADVSDCVIKLIFGFKELPFLAVLGTKLFTFVLPMLIFTFVDEYYVRRGWLADKTYNEEYMNDQVYESENKDRKDKKKLKNDPIISLIINLFFIFIGFAAFANVILDYASIFAVIKLFGGYALQILLIAASVVTLILLIRINGTHKVRRKFVKAIKSECTAKGYKFTIRFKPFKGLLYCSGIPEVIVETDDKCFVCTFVPVYRKNSVLYFTPYNEYRYCVHFLRRNIFLPRHKLHTERLTVNTDKQIEKYVLITKEPKIWAFGDDYKAYEVYNGSSLNGYSAYEALAFCRYIGRL